jgi:2-methylisocitrate lyase-like PEP mutase family enzyme
MVDRAKPSLKALIQGGTFVTAPGVYDLLSALVADTMPFHALYMTGYGISASHMGLPDAGLTTYADMVDRAGRIAERVGKPLIADADTGYGGLLNVRHTVRGYEAAGVAAIQIEDQETPKKCGHTLGRRVVPLDDMVLKIRVAVDARRSDETLIVARTDSRTALGLDEALRRAEAYARAGADVIFVESPETEEEFARIGRAIDTPLLANMVTFGRSPLIPSARLRELGFAVAIHPAIGFDVAAEAMRRAYRHLLDTGTSVGMDVPLYSDAGDMHTLVGFDEIWEFERKWDEIARRPAAE